jgi:hypothetical protein
MRTENNLGEDGDGKTSVKVHHPPGGGSSLNLFGGDYNEPVYEKPKYTAPTYQSQSSYDAPPAGGFSYDRSQPPNTYSNYEEKPSYNSYEQQPSYSSYEQQPSYQSYQQEEYKQPSYYAAPPSGFTSSSSYGMAQPIEPTNLNVSSAPKVFGQRVESGLNSGPTTGKSSTRVHAPPGGKSSIFF